MEMLYSRYCMAVNHNAKKKKKRLGNGRLNQPDVVSDGIDLAKDNLS